MITITSYSIAVVLCIVTMLCWGSWGNTQKLASKGWAFQLFYWDYSIGVVLFTLMLGLTMGSMGSTGQSFIADLTSASPEFVLSALVGGIIFNLSNILLVAAIDLAGMAVAFPVGVGLALVLGVITTYMENQTGNVKMLGAGVACVVIAIILDALAYKRLGQLKKGSANSSNKKIVKGIIVSIISGSLMGLFYSYVVAAMEKTDELGKIVNENALTAYSAVFIFAVGIFLSNFVFNTLIMRFPISGGKVGLLDYFKNGNLKLHMIGILGGAIWCCGTSLSFLCADAAGPALAYGLGQGATMVSAFWGVFIWKEFKGADKTTNILLALMFVMFLSGLGILVASKL